MDHAPEPGLYAAQADSPAARAEHLLRNVLGEEQFRRLRSLGYLDLPSRRVKGRVYRLDSLGNLTYRDAGEAGFNTTLCVQPKEAVPRDDQIAMRYLLVTADEDRLLEVANPITFGFVSLTRALYHDFNGRYPAWAAALMTLGVVLFFLGSLALEFWALLSLIETSPIAAVILFLVFLVPAFIGVILVIAAVVEAVRTVRTFAARSRLAG